MLQDIKMFSLKDKLAEQEVKRLEELKVAEDDRLLAEQAETDKEEEEIKEVKEEKVEENEEMEEEEKIKNKGRSKQPKKRKK